MVDKLISTDRFVNLTPHPPQLPEKLLICYSSVEVPTSSHVMRGCYYSTTRWCLCQWFL